MSEDAFLRHYRRFFGMDEGRFASGETVFACGQRTVPVCWHSVTPLLATVWRDRVVFSVDPAHEDRVRRWFGDLEFDALDDALLGEMDDCFHEVLPLRDPWRMLRLTVTPQDLVLPAGIERVEVVTEEHRDAYHARMRPRGKRTRRFSWVRSRKIREEGRKFAVMEDGEVAADGFVSDIDHRGGNLAVHTAEKHRRKGHGAAVVAAAARWCFEHDVVPVYWVEQKNEPSVHLAEALGFARRHEELTIRVVR
ncbi:MAG: GNAT family N-acetyltransferase [Planctomycetota bacterium]